MHSGLVDVGAASFAADDNPAPSFRLWTALALPTAAWLVLSGYLQRWAPDSAPLRWGALAVTVGVLAVVSLLPLRFGRLHRPVDVQLVGSRDHLFLAIRCESRIPPPGPR